MTCIASSSSTVTLYPGVPGGGCGNDRYTVFTEVGFYLDWIAAVFGLEPPPDYQF